MSGKTPFVATLYLASAATSMLGNSVAQIVWPWLVLARTGDPAAAGLVATVVAIPSLLFAFVGGHLVDTVGRKTMSVISDVISGLSVVGVILVDQAFGLDLWWFTALGVIGALGDVPGMAARNALVGDVSESSGVTVEKISGINQSLVGIAFLIGPALAGFLMSVLDIQLVLWITASCSLIAALLTAMLRLRASESQAVEKETFRGWRAWATVVRAPEIRLLVSVALGSSVLVAPLLTVLLPAQFESVGRPLLLGLSMSFYAVGMIVGGGLISWVGAAYRRRIWVITMLLYVASLLGTAWLSNTWAVFCGLFCAGLAGGLFGPVQMLIVTEAIPEQIRGRAFSLFNAIALFAAPIGLAMATVVLRYQSIYWLAVAIGLAWIPIAFTAIALGIRVFPAYRPAEVPSLPTAD